MRNTFPPFRPWLHLCCSLFVLLFGSTATLGQTSFAPAQDFPYLYNPNLYYLPIMYSADVDADNKKDVIILDDNGIVWYKNEGNGNFSDGTQIVDFAQYSKMFPNDIDQDGDIDLVGANSFDGNVDYYANDGSGNFSDAQTIFVVDNEPPLSFEPEFVHINMTDFDNDGDDDVVYHQITNGILTWRPNNGNGNFSEEFPIDTISSWLNIPIIIIDFDNNGSKDIIAILSSEGLTYVYTNDGSGNFTEVQLNNSNLLSINADAKILTIDINNDGREDIVMSNLGDNLLWFENQGNGNFGSAQIIENGNLGATSFDLIAADIDNDGDADLVSLGSLYTDDAVFPFQTISWHENNDGSFNQHLIDIMLLFLAPIENPYYNYNDLFLVEDFDNDGDFDVLSYIFDDMDVNLYENLLDTPTPTAPTIAAFTTTPSPQTTDTLRICEGQSVSFLNQSQNANAYLWNFGDGTTTTQNSPQHSFQEAGTYTVSLVAAQNTPLTFECEASAGYLGFGYDMLVPLIIEYNQTNSYQQQYYVFDQQEQLLSVYEDNYNIYGTIGGSYVAVLNSPTGSNFEIANLSDLLALANTDNCIDFDVYDRCSLGGLRFWVDYSQENQGYVIRTNNIYNSYISDITYTENFTIIPDFDQFNNYQSTLLASNGQTFPLGSTVEVCPIGGDLLFCCQTLSIPDTIPGGGNQDHRIFPKSQNQIPSKIPTKQTNNSPATLPTIRNKN